tara:strand:- start:66 stop:167 length:102 start_codon:yes stop_codon:yes gene_type:complete
MNKTWTLFWSKITVDEKAIVTTKGINYLKKKSI